MGERPPIPEELRNFNAAFERGAKKARPETEEPSESEETVSVEPVIENRMENPAILEIRKRINSPENYKGPTEISTTDGTFTLEWTRNGWQVIEDGFKTKTYRNKEDVMLSANNILVIAGKQRGMVTPPSFEQAA